MTGRSTDSAMVLSKGAAARVVLIGFAEALPAPEVAWSLVDAGFKVLAFGRRGRRSALRHSHHVEVLEITPPETDAAAALKDLHDLCRQRTGDLDPILFPLDDSAVWLCTQSPFPSSWRLAGCPPESSRLALDKTFQVQAAQQAGFQTPATAVASTVDAVVRSANYFPVILKAAQAVVVQDGRIRKGRSWICADAQELDRALQQWQGRWPVLVQPFIPGTGEGVFGLATPHGVQAWSAHRRLRMMNPHGSGSSACESLPVPEDLKAPVERLVQSAGWRGLFMVEMLRDHLGVRWFMEFNGRSWGSMALSRRLGLEYPAWAAQLALNPELRVGEVRAGAPSLVCRNAGRELMHLLFVIRGPKSTALKDWPTVWRAVREVCRVARMDRFYNYRRDDARVFFSDCWQTIRDQVFKH